MIKKNIPQIIGFTLLLQLFSVLQLHASPVDMKPYVSLDAVNDSNLFRLSEDAKALPELQNRDYSEDYYKAAIGSDFSWQYERQKFDIDAELNSNKFKQYDVLDYTGGHVNARWYWVHGKLWNGKASYNFNQKLKGFENMLTPRRDIKTDNRFDVEADRKIDERWFARFRGNFRDVSFSKSALNDKQVLGLNAGYFYKSHANNTAGVELRVSDAKYQNRDVDVSRLIDDGYMRSSLDAVALWTFSRKSKINARLGYTRQDQNNISENDFDGLTGRFVHYWTVSSKTKIQTSIWRQLSTLGDEIANYAVVTGIGLQADWGVANKTKIFAGVNYEQRDFKEDLEDLLVGDASIESREDDVFNYWLGLVYNPIQSTSLELAYNNGKRESNRALRDYDYNSITGIIKFAFN